MSTVGSPRPFAHRHFGFDNPHALGAGRLSPLSHDSLVAMSCSLINFSSRASSRWVHMDVTFESHFPLSGSLPDLLCAPSALPPEAGNRHPVPRVSFLYSNFIKGLSIFVVAYLLHQYKYKYAFKGSSITTPEGYSEYPALCFPRSIPQGSVTRSSTLLRYPDI